MSEAFGGVVVGVGRPSLADLPRGEVREAGGAGLADVVDLCTRERRRVIAAGAEVCYLLHFF